MNSVKLILLSAIFPFFTNAQSTYKEGYVITSTGDTLRGLVNYNEWYYNPEKINFKQATGHIVMDVTPSNSKEVTIIGFVTYQSFKINISMHSLQLEKLTETENDSSVTKTVFLNLLQKGDLLDLYAYTDKLKMRFYILKKNKNTPEELLYEKKIETMQEQTLYMFRQQLLQYAIEYNAITEKLQDKMQYVQYDEKSLKKIISNINTSNETTGKESNIKAHSTSYFAGIGIMQASIKYTGADFITADGVDANSNNKYKNVTTTNFTPRIAGGINFYSKRWLHRLGIKTEVSAYRFTSTITSYSKYNNLSAAENHYTFNLKGWNFTITPQLIYKFYSSYAVKAYVAAGPGFNILTALKNSIYKVGINQPLTFNETTNNYFPLKNFNISVTARGGIQIKDKMDFYIYWNSPIQYNVFNPEDFSAKSGVVALCAAYNF